LNTLGKGIIILTSWLNHLWLRATVIANETIEWINKNLDLVLINEEASMIIRTGGFVLGIMIIALFLYQTTYQVSLKRRRQNLLTQVYRQIDPSTSTTQVWKEWASIIKDLFPHHNCFVYYLNEQRDEYLLRSSLLNDNVDADTSHDKQYQPPTTLKANDVEGQLKELIGGQKLKLLWMSLDNKKYGFIQLGPGRNRFSRARVSVAQDLTRVMTYMLPAIMERDSLRKKVEDACNISDAATILTQSSMGSSLFVDSMVKMVTDNFKADACYLLVNIEGSTVMPVNTVQKRPLVLYKNINLSEVDITYIESKLQSLTNHLNKLKLTAYLKQKFTLAEEPFSLLIPTGYEALISVPLWSNEIFWGLLVLIKHNSGTFNSQLLPTAIISANRIAINFDNFHLYQKITQTYVDTLKSLADYDDSVALFTSWKLGKKATFCKELYWAIGVEPPSQEAI